MITSVLQPLLKDTRRPNVPVLLMLDEFAQLGHLPVVEQSLGLMRGYGLKLWAVFQDFAQARAIYEDRWQSFLGNAGVLQAFAPQDVVTAKDLADAAGQTTRAPFSASGGGTDATFSTSEIPVPLMLPQDLRNMDDGFSTIFTHKAKGPVRVFLPFPTELSHMRSICALDPSL
jgi:type IV secretion system protein VirD4